MCGAKLLIEWAAQILGAISGAAVVKVLAHGQTSVGCFAPPSGTPQTTVFGMETLATFLLVSTVLATAVDMSGAEGSRTRFNLVAPLAIGLSLWAAAQAVGPWTGGALNTARVLGPAVAGACPSDAWTDASGQSRSGAWTYFGSYVGAHALASVAAALAHSLRVMLHDSFNGCSPPSERKQPHVPVYGRLKAPSVMHYSVNP